MSRSYIPGVAVVGSEFKEKKCEKKSGKVFLSAPSQPGVCVGGGGSTLPPLPGTLRKYLKNAFSYGLETFWKFKFGNKFGNKKLFFNRLCQSLATIAKSKVEASFEEHISAVFM